MEFFGLAFLAIVFFLGLFIVGFLIARVQETSLPIDAEESVTRVRTEEEN